MVTPMPGSNHHEMKVAIVSRVVEGVTIALTLAVLYHGMNLHTRLVGVEGTRYTDRQGIAVEGRVDNLEENWRDVLVRLASIETLLREGR